MFVGSVTIKGPLFLLNSYINLDRFAEEICDIDGRDTLLYSLHLQVKKYVFVKQILLALIMLTRSKYLTSDKDKIT